jgi:hypothetical protein
VSDRPPAHARRRRATPPRDSEPSAFAPILADLVSDIPGALSAAFVDAEGETVDYAGVLDPFDARVAAAHWHIVLSEATSASFGPVDVLHVRGRRRSFAIRRIFDDYAIVVVLSRRAGFGSTRRAFAACERAIADEAGWTLGPNAPRWYRAKVECDARGRPERVADPSRPSPRWREVEVLGTIFEHSPSIPTFRVRLDSGAELGLVRERGARWFTDERIDVHTRSAVPAGAEDFARRFGQRKRL